MLPTTITHNFLGNNTLVVEESIHVIFNEAKNSSNWKEENLDDVASKIFDKTKELTLNDTKMEDLDEIQNLNGTSQSEVFF